MDAGVKAIADHLDETWSSLLKTIEEIDDNFL